MVFKFFIVFMVKHTCCNMFMVLASVLTWLPPPQSSRSHCWLSSWVRRDSCVRCRLFHWVWRWVSPGNCRSRSSLPGHCTDLCTLVYLNVRRLNCFFFIIIIIMIIGECLQSKSSLTSHSSTIMSTASSTPGSASSVAGSFISFTRSPAPVSS